MSAQVPELRGEQVDPPDTTQVRKWIEHLPPFCSADTVALIFDITRGQAVRWMSGDGAVLPRAQRPDKKYVTTREHVVKLAEKLYGEMGL